MFTGLNKNPSFFKLGVYLSQYMGMVFSTELEKLNLSVTTKSEVILDIYFFELLEVIFVMLKKTDFRFNKVSDIVVYDRPSFALRYVISYILSNPNRELKVRIRFTANATSTVIMSISEIIRSSNWAEREAMDMFGVKFLGHRDLRRIIGDYGLWGFPGRKDFPLVGLYSYFYVINFLRVFRIRGMLSDFWSIYFQKKIYTQC